MNFGIIIKRAIAKRLAYDLVLFKNNRYLCQEGRLFSFYKLEEGSVLQIFNKYLKLVLAVTLIGMLMTLYACRSYTPNNIEADEIYEIESYYLYEEYEDEIEIYYYSGYDEGENISEYGLKVLSEFLMQFPTLFMNTSSSWVAEFPSEAGEIRHFGIPRWNENEQVFETGTITVERPSPDGSRTFLTSERIKTTETPPLFLRRTWTNDGLDGFYTANGERIEDAPWMWMHGYLYATDFMLYDFDDNGIPSVKIYYWGHFEGSGDGGSPFSLFRYVDGEFRRMYSSMNIYSGEGEPITNPWWSVWPQYYIDDERNLILYSFIGFDVNIARYSFLNFDGQKVNYGDIVSGQGDWERSVWGEGGFTFFYWNNHITGKSEEELKEQHIGPAVGSRTIPTTDINIRPLRSMRNLHNEITKYISEKMYENGIFDDWLHILIATSTKMYN